MDSDGSIVPGDVDLLSFDETEMDFPEMPQPEQEDGQESTRPQRPRLGQARSWDRPFNMLRASPLLGQALRHAWGKPALGAGPSTCLGHARSWDRPFNMLGMHVFIHMYVHMYVYVYVQLIHAHQ